MLGLILGAAILGVIIAVMEDGEFPGWLSMIACVLDTVVPATIVNSLMPPSRFIVGLAVGAVGMTFPQEISLPSGRLLSIDVCHIDFEYTNSPE